MQKTLAVLETAATSGGTNTFGGFSVIQNWQKERNRLKTGFRGFGVTPSVIILVTDGQPDSTTQAKSIADDLKAAGNTIITVGVTAAINKEQLTALATSEAHVLNVANFDDLENQLGVLTDIVKKACASTTTVTTTTATTTTTITTTTTYTTTAYTNQPRNTTTTHY